MSIESFISNVARVIVNPIIVLLFAAALVSFLWGVFQYIRNADSSEGRETGRNHIIWGLVGMFIMVAVFAIIDIAMNTVYGS